MRIGSLKSARLIFFPVLLAAYMSGAGPASKEPAYETYTFGDDMKDFVRDSVFFLSDAFVRMDYPARSLNGFQVTLDKSRAAVNGAMESIIYSAPAMDSIRSGANLVIKMRSDPTLELTNQEIAMLASYTSSVNTFLNKLAYHHEQIVALKKTLLVLDQPLSFDQFVEEQLDEIPHLFILSAMRGKPDFNQIISVTITIDNDGAGNSGPNSTNGFMSFINLLAGDKERKQYFEQSKKYHRAIEDIKNHLPRPDSCYQIYKRGFLLSKALFGSEPGLLHQHMDSVIQELKLRYKTISEISSLIENGLLSDRVKAAFSMLSLNSFDASSRAVISSRLLQIRSARLKVLELRQTIDPKSKSVNNFMTLEDIKETCLAIEIYIRSTDSLLLFHPIKKELPRESAWFQKQGEWARSCLSQGFIPDSIQSKIYDIRVVKRKEAEKMKVLTQKQKTSGSIKTLNLAQVNEYPELSFTITWPTSGGQPFHGSFPRSGLEVWFRSSDGGFANDGRRGGNFYAGWISEDLRNRTSAVRTNYFNAQTQAASAAPTRQQEIRAQATTQQTYSDQTRSTRRIIPLGNIPPAHSQMPTVVFNELDPIHTTKTPGLETQIQTEIQRQGKALEGLTPEQLGSGPVLQYRNTHNKYLAFSYGLASGGFLKESAAMLKAAQGLRSQFQGYPVANEPMPSFEKPDVPFPPLTRDYYNTVSQRSAAYLQANDRLRSKSRWFEAAAIVTSVNGLGALDAIDFTHGYGFSTTADFLRETNESLFPINMMNAIRIEGGTLDQSFTTPTGEVVSFKNLSGKELDYALVKFEQTQVEQYLQKYERTHSYYDAATSSLMINLYMRAPWLPDVVSRAMFDGFNFRRYEDRVKLGQRIIDELYKKP